MYERPATSFVAAFLGAPRVNLLPARAEADAIVSGPFRLPKPDGALPRGIEMPRMIVAQATGCAPIVQAIEQGTDRATPWENPMTHAAGLRVPGPLGDRVMLRAVRESGGDGVAIAEEDIRSATSWMTRETGIDAAPEGGCALAVLRQMTRDGRIAPDSEVVVFNTGSGASYRA